MTVKSGQYSINPEALETIRSLDGPLVVIGVAGLYRTGKSYLLNRVILNREKGFGVGSSVNACTKGIWMWSKPLKTQTKSGKLANVIVLDSEGLGAIDQDSAHDCRIFSLVLLLTSVFIFNSVGAIDENAISNLSLVINLTKHIETSSRSKFDSSVDFDELHKYFPSFVWVLRDFSLQLVDEYGSDITAREYLENALQEQTGISDEVEQKNRIRRLVKNFFRERNCHTLVRPITEEEELQALDCMDFDQLRPEFVEQALELRNALFTIENFKTFHGKQVNGSMLAGIIENYVSTINAGAVPNLENTWIYICKNHNKKLLIQCEREFDNAMTQKVKDHIPMSDLYVAEIYHEAKEAAVRTFENKSLGEEKASYIEMLKRHCKEHKNSLMEDNDREFEMLLYNEMSNQYNETLFKKIMNKAYKHLSPFIDDIKRFVDGFMGSGPDGPLKAERVYKFGLTKALEGVELVNQIQEDEFRDSLHSKETNNLKLISDYEQQIKESDDKLASLKSALTDIENKMYEKDLELKGLKESNSRLKTQLEAANARYSNAIDEGKSKNQEQVNQLTEKVSSLESQLAVQIKANKTSKSDSETKVALLQDKLAYLENVEKESRKLREKHLKRQQDIEEEYKLKLNSFKEEAETRLTEAQSQIRKLNEQKSCYEDEINKKCILNESIQVDFTKRESELKSIVEQKDGVIEDLKAQLDSVFKENEQLPEREKRLSDEIASLTAKLEEADSTVKKREDEVQQLKMVLEKEREVVGQKQEFYEIRIKDMEEEIAELKKMKDVTINSFQTKSVSKAEVMRQLQECKSMYEESIKALKEEHENELAEINEKYRSIIDNDESVTSELKKKKDELLMNCQELQHQLMNIEAEKHKLAEQLKAAEDSKASTLNELQQVYERRIKELEAEIERLVESRDSDIEAANQSSEERIRKLREIYEQDKAKLEQKVADEKLKAQRYSEELSSDLESKYKLEISSKDDEIEALREQLEDAEMQISNMECLVEEERNAYNEKILEINRQHENERKELSESFEREAAKLKREIDARTRECDELTKTTANLKSLIQEKEAKAQEVQIELEKAVETHAKDINERDEAIEDLKATKESLEDRLNKLNTERNSLSEELIELRMQLNKETALNQQRAEFDKKKIADLESSLATVESTADENLCKVRTELEAETKSLREYIDQTETELRAELEEKSKALKELENSTSLTITELEKTNQLLADKVSFTENRKAELEAKYKSELEAGALELKKLTNTYNADRKSHMEEINELKKKNYDLDITIAEAQAKADKDKAVFEGRIQFLEQQNKKLKADLNENQHNFDLMFQKLHQYRQADKEEIESSHTAYVNSLEERYNGKIADMKAKHKEAVDYLKDRVKNQEKEIKKLTAQKQEMQDQRYGNGIIHEKRINELLESETALQQEVASLKAERDKLAVSFQTELEKQKENIKKKVTDLEQRFKKCENEKNQIQYDKEKLKAKWLIEKDGLISERNEALETIERLQKQKDGLSKDLDKVRQEFKSLRKSTLNMSSFGFSKKKVTQYFANKNKKEEEGQDTMLSEMDSSKT